jgi:uncharacterized protein (TIGR03118 family)
MTLWSHHRLTSFGKPASISGQQSRRRLIVECLEERMLLSGGYAQVNLASDVPGLASVTDASLVNPWGIALSPTGPFWFANNANGVGALLDGRGQPLPLLVSLASTAQSDGSPTGAVFNSGPGFRVSENGVSAPSRFLFASEDGTISGWTAVVDWTHAVLAVDNSSSGAVYKGLAVATDPAGQTLLYAADFGRGSIDVFDQSFNRVERAGSFQDLNLPEGFAPFNIQNIHDQLFVTYAQHEQGKADDLPGAGNGFVDVYDADGNLVRRFASQGPLNSPWALALAPPGFGPFGGALLVGNNGDGHINAYDPESGVLLGTLPDGNGSPLTVPDLWALTFGNGHLAGDGNTLFFTAGVDNEMHGLFGAIQAPQRRGADTAGPGFFDPHAPGEPGDYPLPPNSEPAILNRDDGSGSSADLLPIRESSLALIPTLVSAASPRARTDAPVSATSVGSSFLQVFVATAPPAAGSRIIVPPDLNVPVSQNTLALDTLLNLIIAQNLPENPAPGQRLEFISYAGDAQPSIIHFANVGAQLPGSQIADLPVQPDAPRTPIPSEGRFESVVNGELQNKAAGTDNRTSWMDLLNPVVVVVSIPMICNLCGESVAGYVRYLQKWSDLRHHG